MHYLKLPFFGNRITFIHIFDPSIKSKVQKIIAAAMPYEEIRQIEGSLVQTCIWLLKYSICRVAIIRLPLSIIFWIFSFFTPGSRRKWQRPFRCLHLLPPLLQRHQQIRAREGWTQAPGVHSSPAQRDLGLMVLKVCI